MKLRPEYDMKVIGDNLKRLREAKSLSVKDVQEYLGLGSVQAIYKYESGKGYPQVDTMFALMELYGADLYDIVCKHDKQNLFFVIHSYQICGLNTEIEIINIEDFKIQQNHRLKKYREYLEKGIAS